MLDNKTPIKKAHKGIKGAIRRAIDINRGDIKIPENKLIQIRKNPNDDKLVALFFNSVFTSYDNVYEGEDDDNQSWAMQIADESEPYNPGTRSAIPIKTPLRIIESDFMYRSI